jgi:hypothetical protein
MPLAVASAALRLRSVTALLSGVLGRLAGVLRRQFIAAYAAFLGTLSAVVVGRPGLTSKAPSRHVFTVSCKALVAALLAGVLGALSLAWKAVRSHPFSVACTALLVTLSSSLLGVSAPLALVLWALASLLSLATWRALEPFVLARLGCRPPSHLERERLDPALGSVESVRSVRVEVLVLDAAEPWLGRGLRSLVLSRALLDLLEDRALAGILAQAGEQVRTGSLPGELVVWLGNLPLLSVWSLSRGLVQLGRLLAI